MIKVLLALFVTLVGCEDKGDYVYYDNPPRIQKSDRTYPLRDILQDAKIDILWVVDNSGSMSNIQRNIVRNASSFMQEFTQNNIMKWRMGVLSTDRNENPYLGFQNTFDNTNVDPVTNFANAIDRLGTNGSASEYVFYNVKRGVSFQTPFNNFYRTDAHLAVIMVTDEKAQSERQFGSQYEPITFLNSLRAMKSPEKILRFYGAFGLADLQDCSSWGDDYAGSPFETIINTTEGIHFSACIPDYGSKLAEIGRDIVSIVDTPRIILRKRPKIQTIKVLFNGKELLGGREVDGGFWYYSKYFNTINFYNLDFVPDISKANIQIKFDVDDGFDHDEWRSKP